MLWIFSCFQHILFPNNATFLTSVFEFSAAVVQLKTLTSALAVDEQLSSSSAEKTRTLQKLLVYVVSVVFIFVELRSSATMENQFVDIVKYLPSKDNLIGVPSSNPKSLISEKKLDWQQKAIVLVMEAGGVNWLVGKVCLSYICLLVHLLHHVVYMLDEILWTDQI